MSIRCVDLFCGVGGLTHGLARAGIRVVAGVDVDPDCQYPYEANNEAKFVHEDVSDLDATTLRALWGRSSYTMLAGCAPCQPFSTYSRVGRKERGENRWGLVRHFAGLIVSSQPDFVTMENVPQLLDHKVFSEFTGTLSGYHLSHQVVECSMVGIPQTRKRLVVVASRHGAIALDFPLVPPQEQSTVRTAIYHLPSLDAGDADRTDSLHRACSLSDTNLERIRASRPGGTWRDWPKALVAKCHRRKTGDTYPSVYGRMEWDKPAPTITTQCFGYGNGRFGHPSQDRAITLREAALLQTFPANYQFVRRDERVRFSTLGRLIGNAVPVRLGELVGNAIRDHATSVRPFI